MSMGATTPPPNRNHLSYDYLIYRQGDTYLVKCSNELIYPSNSSFPTLLNAVIAGASSGETICIKEGVFVHNAAVTGKSGVSIVGSGPGTILDGSTMAASATMINYAGSQGSQVNLSENAAIRDNHVHVAVGAEAGFAVDDLVSISSTAVWDGNSLNQLEGEFFHVASTASGLLNLSATNDRFSLIMGTYTTATTAHLHKTTPVKDFVLRDFTIKGDGATQVYGIRVTYGENVLIQGINVDKVNSHGIWFTNTINSRVIGCGFNGCNQAGLGYGVDMEYACQGITILGCNFVNCRHCVTIGGGSGAGIPRGIVITGCTAEGGADDANYDCHAVGEGIVFNACVSLGGEYGFAVNGHTISVSNCSIIGASVQGIRFNNANYDEAIAAHNHLIGCATGITVVAGSVNVHLIYNSYVNCGTTVSDSGTSTETIALA